MILLLFKIFITSNSGYAVDLVFEGDCSLCLYM